MKRLLYIHTILSTALWATGCSQPEDLYAPGANGNQLAIHAELVSTSEWASTRADEQLLAGQPSEDESHEWLVTTNRGEWCGNDVSPDAPVTRGTPITSATSIANLRVNVFHTGTSNWSTSATRTRTIDATRDGNDFLPNIAYNWPTDATNKVTLFAFTPVPTADNGLTDTAPNKISYTVPTTVAKQPDLCVALPDMNIINNTGSKHIRTFSLRHQLTAVGFTMLGWNLKVTDVTISGVIIDGTMTMNSGSLTWAIGSTTGSRSIAVTGSSYQHTVNNNYADITKSDGHLMMIPQTLTDAATVTIKYESTGTGSTGGTITVKLKDLGVTWNAGDKITYNIRLKTAPAVTTNELFITTHRVGYTTSEPLTFLMDNLDNLTFTWTADWLKIHRGNPSTGISPGGAPSGWSTGTGGPWTNIYFFATTENTSRITDRTATVTVSGTRSGTRTFTVQQAKKSDYIKIGSLYWAKGNLVATGNNTCKIGAPTDYGIYFQFGSLIGWTGGATGNGEGIGSPALNQAVWPTEMGSKPTFGWQNENVNGTKTLSNYYFNYTIAPWGNDGQDIRGFNVSISGDKGTGNLATARYAKQGVGDPCTYYLGDLWRLPTTTEIRNLSAAGSSGWTANGGVNGRWLGTNPGSESSSVFFAGSGARYPAIGNLDNGNGYCWSSTIRSFSHCYNLNIFNNMVTPDANNFRSFGFPIRCVRQTP